MDKLIWRQLESWYASPLGRQLFAEERRMLSYALSRCSGQEALQVGGPFRFQLPLQQYYHATQVVADTADVQSVSQVVGSLDDLPISDHSVDLVLLPHVLSYAENPDSILIQSDNALADGGSLVILGFNPFSLWGLSRGVFKKNDHLLGKGKFLSAFRLYRWLYRHDYYVSQHMSCFFRPPIHDMKKLKYWQIFEWVGQMCCPLRGASYILVARKKTESPVVSFRREILRSFKEVGQKI